MRIFNTFTTVFLLGIVMVSCKQETMQGDYFGEDDIVRIEDDYNRE